MTEQLVYNIYKISNSVDDKIYIGSTRSTAKTRFSQHKCGRNCWQGKDKKPTKIQQHLLDLGVDKFSVETVITVTVSTRIEALKVEHEELHKFPKERWLNIVIPYSFNHDQTRDIEKKRQNRRDFYARQKEDPEWLAKERERTKLGQRVRRAKAKAEADAATSE
jgi:hypothetical protein